MPHMANLPWMQLYLLSSFLLFMFNNINSFNTSSTYLKNILTKAKSNYNWKW